MKKVFYFFVLFFFYINVAHSKNNIAYLDVQLIIDKSDLGKFYKKKYQISMTRLKLN